MSTRAWLAPIVLSATTACAAVAWSSPACAEPSRSDAVRAMQLNEAGSNLYSSGDYAGALDSFERAYALIAEPNLLFNIAGCHEQLGQKGQAVEYYRWFLGTSSSNPEGRRRAIAALGRLETEPAPPPPPPPPEPESSAWDSPVWPAIMLGSGILFAGLGAGLYLDGAHDHNEVTSSPGFGDASGSSMLTEVEAQRLIDSGDTKKLLGGISFGLGAALIATNIVITVWHSNASDNQASSAEIRLIPGGWAVAGKF